MFGVLWDHFDFAGNYCRCSLWFDVLMCVNFVYAYIFDLYSIVSLFECVFIWKKRLFHLKFLSTFLLIQTKFNPNSNPYSKTNPKPNLSL